MIGEIHVDDVGTLFSVTIKDENDTVVDVSSATVTFTFSKPDGTQFNRTASLVTDGTDGNVKYNTVANDLDTHGRWKLQAFVDFGSTEWYSDIYKFTVYPNLGC